MCGISGILNKKNKGNLSARLQKMTDVIEHRGPDGEGHWVNEKQTVGLGHRRLSIIDLSDKATQPMVSFNQRYVISFNGEIYNYVELREQLINLGYSFYSDSDTEVLLVGYQHYGESFLTQLDGMFAFAIWDTHKEELFCARDRFGEKPFYFFNDNQQFVFASEIKSIFASGISKSVDEKMLYLYLAYDVVENPNDKFQTFYKNIQSLPASHSLKVEKTGKLIVKRYWSIDTSLQIECSETEAQEKFRELFDQSIKRRMRSDVKVGSSLSGGVDSSSIVCSVLNLFPEINFNTFTARFSDVNFDEGHFIKELQNTYSFNSNECFPESYHINDLLDKVFYHQEEPFGSASILAQWEVMKLARSKDTIVLLDGQGADEAFAGYFKYFLPFLYEIKNNKDYASQKKAIEEHLGVEYFLSKRDSLRMKSPKIFDFISSMLRSYRNNVGQDLNRSFIKEYKKEPTPFHQDTNLNDFLRNDLFMYGLGKLLRFSDRNAMAHSVEVRLPYLSHELVEFVFSLPSRYKINKGWTKSILRESMQNRVPHKILYRKDKKGFQPPNSWMETSKALELINDSISVLKQNHFLEQPIKANYWQYIMGAKLLSKDL